MATFGYIRVSTDQQQLSIEAQRERLQAYCEFRNLHLDDIFADPDVSGSKPILSRPAGSRLCETVKKGDDVIAVKLDRCFRDAADGINTLFWWQDQGVTLHLADSSAIADTRTAAGFLTIAIQLVVGQYERMATSERTSQAMRSAQSNGKRMSKLLPYGFEEDPESEFDQEVGMFERIRENPAEQATLKDMQMLNEKGLGYQAIATKLNEHGYNQRNGKPWSRQMVWGIIARKK